MHYLKRLMTETGQFYRQGWGLERARREGAEPLKQIMQQHVALKGRRKMLDEDIEWVSLQLEKTTLRVGNLRGRNF